VVSQAVRLWEHHKAIKVDSQKIAVRSNAHLATEETNPSSGWTVVLAATYLLSVEAALGVLIVVLASQSRLSSTALFNVALMVAPFPIELAVLGPFIALIAVKKKSAAPTVATIAVLAILFINTALWLFAFAAWFLVAQCSSNFCG
jgi:hypothetical protein